jgi:hypothetical protein
MHSWKKSVLCVGSEGEVAERGERREERGERRDGRRRQTTADETQKR